MLECCYESLQECGLLNNEIRVILTIIRASQLIKDNATYKKYMNLLQSDYIYLTNNSLKLFLDIFEKKIDN